MSAWEAGKGVVFGGSNKVRVFMKEVTSREDAVVFNESDLVGEATDVSGMGKEAETETLTGYHYTEDLEVVKKVKNKTWTINENLTLDQLSKIESLVGTNTLVAVGLFDGDNVINGIVGQIGNLDETVPNGGVCVLSYTVSGKQNKSMTISTSAG